MAGGADDTLEVRRRRQYCVPRQKRRRHALSRAMPASGSARRMAWLDRTSSHAPRTLSAQGFRRKTDPSHPLLIRQNAPVLSEQRRVNGVRIRRSQIDPEPRSWVGVGGGMGAGESRSGRASARRPPEPAAAVDEHKLLKSPHSRAHSAARTSVRRSLRRPPCVGARATRAGSRSRHRRSSSRER